MITIEKRVTEDSKLRYRRGCFSISLDVFMEDQFSRFGMMLKLFSQFIILDARADAARQKIDYVAVSPLFEVKEEGEEPPWYNIHITEGEGGEVLFKARKYEEGKKKPCLRKLDLSD